MYRHQRQVWERQGRCWSRHGVPIFVIVCGEVRTFCDVSFLAGNAEQRVLFYCGVVSAMRLAPWSVAEPTAPQVSAD